MATSGQTYKNVFKQIFADGWAEFKRNHPRYEAVDEVVQKMLGSGDPANGHVVYLYPDCQQRRVVAFSCKSQFCLSCAKVYGQPWVATVQAMLYPGVVYRHLILTVPERLRALFYQHAALFKRVRYRERMLVAFEHDPLVCPHCGGVLWLWQIWHPRYSVAYDELERMKQGVYERAEQPVCRAIEPDRAGDVGPVSDRHIQVPLFALADEADIPDVVFDGFVALGRPKRRQML
jgi:hypothetical protein